MWPSAPPLTLLLVAGCALVDPGSGFQGLVAVTPAIQLGASRHHASPRPIRMGPSSKRPVEAAPSRRTVLGVLAGLAVMPDTAAADTCTRKDCQVCFERVSSVCIRVLCLMTLCHAAVRGCQRMGPSSKQPLVEAAPSESEFSTRVRVECGII
jgi:hypothetical protein